MKPRKCVYVIGAGFSAGLGYPLTSDLLVRLWRRIHPPLKKKLKRVIEFHHPGFTPKSFTSFPNVEELLSEMMVNAELFKASRQYEGGFTLEDLRDLQRDLLLEITDWFHELGQNVTPGDPRDHPWLARFRDKVRNENAAIISFNWDLILDELLFGEDLSAESYGFSNPMTEGPVLLKPHGSLNWFEDSQGRFLSEQKKVRLFPLKTPLRTADRVYAFKEFRPPRSKHDRIYTPFIVPPVVLKRFEKKVFETLWKNCVSALSTAKKVVFLGYSMPSADVHAQFILRCGFDNQLQGVLIDGGRSKSTGAAKVTIVNPDGSAARRIARVAGPKSRCKWISAPAADWLMQQSATR